MKTRMTLEEFKSFWDLKAKLVESRQICLDYILERASLGLNRSEKMAWFAVYKVLRFVETFKRFPRREELDELLSDRTDKLSDVSLTEQDFWSNLDANTILELNRQRQE